MTHFRFIESPIGRLLLTSDGVALTGLYMEKERHPRPVEPNAIEDPDNPLLATAAAQLAEYFDGRRRVFDVPLAARGTGFQRSVWDELTRIDFGRTVSYGEIARRLGRPGASRAVGLANGSNPISIIVPCHRVIGADGTLTGYGGGLERKQWLLRHEGIGVPEPADQRSLW
jgi:methylated-DNA-[protein]-cysteine S-methyltransferase